MSKWDDRFIELARLVATWSKDPSTKVGAVIADELRRVVSMGFNGFPRGCQDSLTLYENRERKYRRVLHAEQNALSFATRPVHGCTIYVTHAPCARCAAQIIQCGIQRIVCPNPWSDTLYINRWRDDVLETEGMCAEAGLLLDYRSWAND